MPGLVGRQYELAAAGTRTAAGTRAAADKQGHIRQGRREQKQLRVADGNGEPGEGAGGGGGGPQIGGRRLRPWVAIQSFQSHLVPSS